MAGLVKMGWFGRQISVLMVNGKSITGELTETSEQYIVVTRGGAETQIMAHAIVAIRLAERGIGGLRSRQPGGLGRFAAPPHGAVEGLQLRAAQQGGHAREDARPDRRRHQHARRLHHEPRPGAVSASTPHTAAAMQAVADDRLPRAARHLSEARQRHVPPQQHQQQEHLQHGAHRRGGGQPGLLQRPDQGQVQRQVHDHHAARPRGPACPAGPGCRRPASAGAGRSRRTCPPRRRRPRSPCASSSPP